MKMWSFAWHAAILKRHESNFILCNAVRIELPGPDGHGLCGAYIVLVVDHGSMIIVNHINTFSPC